jgi:hypothetical protein
MLEAAPGDYAAAMATGNGDGDHPGEPKATTIPRPVTTPATPPASTVALDHP